MGDLDDGEGGLIGKDAVDRCSVDVSTLRSMMCIMADWRVFLGAMPETFGSYENRSSSTGAVILQSNETAFVSNPEDSRVSTSCGTGVGSAWVDSVENTTVSDLVGQSVRAGDWASKPARPDRLSWNNPKSES